VSRDQRISAIQCIHGFSTAMSCHSPLHRTLRGGDDDMNFPEIVRPAYIGDYVAILREIEIRPDRLTEGLAWWEEYGDQDVVSVALGFEILDGSAEAIRPRAHY